MKIEIWDEISDSDSDWYAIVMERVRQKQQQAKDKDVLQDYNKEPDPPETQPDQSP